LDKSGKLCQLQKNNLSKQSIDLKDNSNK
jgi:hypothetical protein